MLYTSTYLSENKSVYFNAFLFEYPTTKTCFLTLLFLYMPVDAPVHGHAFSFSYFHFILSIQLTVKIYPSMFSLFYMSTDVPVHQYTCSVCFLFFGITCTMTFQLIYWGTYTKIYPYVNLPVYLHASLSSNHKGLPVTTTTCVPFLTCTRSWHYLFIFIL